MNEKDIFDYCGEMGKRIRETYKGSLDYGTLTVI